MGTASAAKDYEKTKNKVTPLFQVDYDRTLCKPLGSAVEFNSSTESTKNTNQKCSLSLNMDVNSRSPSPLPTLTIADNFTMQHSKKKPEPLKSRHNLLTLFEFSSVYPFIYGNNKYKCFVCSQPFLEGEPLRLHMKEHTFSSIKRLMINNRVDTIFKVDVTELTCKICPETLSSFAELKRHLQDHGKIIDPEIQDHAVPFELTTSSNIYKCVICNQEFLKFRLLVIHISVHFSNYRCEVCGNGYMTLRLLKKHLEVHENGNFPCEQCGKIFATPQKRSMHVRGVHLKQCPRSCPLCPERFNSFYARTKHMEDVHNQSTKVHKCDTCGRAFNLKYHMLCHVRSVHLQERNQQCDVCLQRFSNKESLKRHMVIHTGEKNHKCDLCGMAFLRRKNLRDHSRVHNLT